MLEFPTQLASAIQEAIGSLRHCKVPVQFRLRDFPSDEVLWTVPRETPQRRAVRETKVYEEQKPSDGLSSPQDWPQQAPPAAKEAIPTPPVHTETQASQPKLPPGVDPEGAFGQYKGVPLAAVQPKSETGLGLNDGVKVQRIRTTKKG